MIPMERWESQHVHPDGHFVKIGWKWVPSGRSYMPVVEWVQFDIFTPDDVKEELTGWLLQNRSALRR